jgi:hypothetical protein
MSARGKNLEQGETITLFASAARTVTAGTNGTAVYVGGERKKYVFLLTLTAAATEVGDTLDVYVDWSIDGTTYVNGAHFTQILGNGADAQSYYAVFDATTPGTAVIDATSDAAAAAVRPGLFGAYVRGRYVVVEANANANASFTFSLIGYAI